MASEIADRLKQMGIELPEPPKPVASYVGFVRHGDLVFISGQLPLLDGRVTSIGILGRDVSTEDAAEAARICAINLVAQLQVACDGNLDRVARCVRLGGFVASTPEFDEQPKVINGASDFIADLFGEKGAHARAAVGVSSLPLGASVEVEGTFAIG